MKKVMHSLELNLLYFNKYVNGNGQNVLPHKVDPLFKMGCKIASLCEYPAWYSSLKRPLPELSENVKTVKVSVNLQLVQVHVAASKHGARSSVQ